MKSALFMLAMVANACGFEGKPGQGDATEIVWRLRYRDYADKPPYVEWHGQRALNCADDGAGQFVGFYRGSYWGDPSHGHDCVLGVTWVDVNVSEVAWPDGADFSTTAFAHELYHMYLLHATGDPDSGHTDPSWGVNYGFPFGIVDQANADLAGYGY